MERVTNVGEQPLYGSGRLGVRSATYYRVRVEIRDEFADEMIIRDNFTAYTGLTSRTLGRKQYELTDHLGNVRVLFGDRLKGTMLAETIKPQIFAINSYYPYGMLIKSLSQNSEAYRWGFQGHEQDNEIKGVGNHLRFGDYGYDTRLGRRWNLDPVDQIGISNYAVFGNNPIRFVDPDGKAIRLANTESFNVLLSSLPAEARSLIRMDKNYFIDASSVNAAYSQFSNSGNMQALKDIVADKRIVDFNATATSFDYVDSQTGKTDIYNFNSPSRVNMYQELLNEFNGTPQEKEKYSQHLIKSGIIDEVHIGGNLGATLRPADAQEPYPSGQISTTDNFEVYVNPVGTTPIEKAKNVGHELFGHLYFFFIGKDPLHKTPTSNPPLNKQIIDREKESEINFR